MVTPLDRISEKQATYVAEGMVLDTMTSSSGPLMQTTPVVELRSVDFHYRPDEPILSDFNVAVEEGELLVLLGPSGCGKSPTMNLVAGLHAPPNGTVLFGGQPLPGVNRGVGYMNQGATLLPWHTVHANVGGQDRGGMGKGGMGRGESGECA